MFYKKPTVRENFENVFEYVLGGRKYKHILDVGCGTGFYFPILKEYTSKLTGIDFSPEMIQEAKKLIKNKKFKNVMAEIANIEKLKYKDNSFDCVLCFDVLHHIQNLNKGLSEIKRVLKDKCVFIAIEPNMLNPMMFIAHLVPKEERGAVKRNYPGLIKKILKKYFSKVSISYINYIASAKNKKIISILEKSNKTLHRKWYKVFSTRQIVRAYK